MNRRVLLVGGYGTFGARAAERLAHDPRNEIVIAGRDAAAAARHAAELSARSKARITSVEIDATSPDPARLAGLAPTVVYNASGPFQTQDYALARAAIAIGAHYVDLADARAFVAGIGSLDDAAKRAGVLVVSGASSVPGLSSAVVDHLRPRFATIDRLAYAIVPANSFDPGIATTASILSYIGKPFATKRDGGTTRIHGWQGLERRTFEHIGPRWLAACDIPDLALFPEHYPEIRTIDFKAGLEVPAMHLGLWALSWLARAGMMRRPERLAAPLLTLKRAMRRFGSETGFMQIDLAGTGRDGHPLSLTWQIVARDSHGPYIPQMPATALTRALLDGRITTRGAMPCLGVVPLADIQAETQSLAIETHANI